MVFGARSVYFWRKGRVSLNEKQTCAFGTKKEVAMRIICCMPNKSNVSTGRARCSMVAPKKDAKHTAAGIPTWSPTVVLICRSTAYVWQSGRDAQFSADCGRMCLKLEICKIYSYYTVSLHVDQARQRQTLSALGRSRHLSFISQLAPTSSSHLKIGQARGECPTRQSVRLLLLT
jgi:hypothetical protein